MNSSLIDCDQIILITGWGANMGVVTDACSQSVGANSHSVGVSACATAKPETQGGLNLYGVLSNESLLINES